MVENKLYYRDPYIQTFSAKILQQAQDKRGEWYVVLDQTAFYPAGGGQPHDMGTIAGQAVIRVEEMEGEIRHYLQAPIAETAKEVAGAVDWDRRFDHMQQHTGQHILSAAFDHLYEYKTVGFHLGAEIVTIDLETEKLTDAEAAKAEELANQIILENRRIEVKWVSDRELSQYQLRKETKVKEDIRLVIIPEFDYNGCGGTHPKATGEVRAVKVLAWEREKKNVRVHFVCGERVIRQFHQKQTVLLELTKLLSSPEKEMIRAVTRILEKEKSMEKSLDDAHNQLLHYEARRLLETKSETGRYIRKVFQNRPIQDLQKLARLITSSDDEALVLMASENDQRIQLVGARGPARKENMKNIITEGLRLINGKGGGSESFAQGGGVSQISANQLLDHLLSIEENEM